MAENDLGSAGAEALAHHLGQVSLDSSPVLTAKTPKFTRKYSLRELEIQQTIGWRARAGDTCAGRASRDGWANLQPMHVKAEDF